MHDNKELFSVSLVLCGDRLPVDEVAEILQMPVSSGHKKPDNLQQTEQDTLVDPPFPCFRPQETNVCVIRVTRGPDDARVRFQKQIESFLPLLEARSELLGQLLSLPGVEGHFSLEYASIYAGYGSAYLSPEQLRCIGNLGLGIIVMLYRMSEESPDEDEDNEPPYPCPCCGFLVFDEAPGSYNICPVCNWEDDAVQLRYPNMADGANSFSLWQEQQRILKLYPVTLRETKGHMRDSSWRPLRSEELVTEGAPQTSREYFDALGAESPSYYWLRDELGESQP